VAIARLLIQAAEFVVADEPVSSLDPTSALDVLRLLGTSATTGTLLVSLHQPELVRDHFSRAVGLRAGRVTFDVAARDLDRACLDELYARP
jgi:phosphonate transport system ATP-binding protein